MKYEYLKAMGMDIQTPLDGLWNDTGVSYWDFRRLCGHETTKAVVKKMPNMLKKKGGKALDEAADEYGFESDWALCEAMINFVSKRVLNKRLEEEHALYLSMIEAKIEQEEGESCCIQ